MECYIGQIELFPYYNGRAPYQWMKCDGSSLNTAQYSPLFSLIGYKYGGSGNTFNLPNLQGTEPIPGVYYCICVEGGYFPTQG